MELTSNTEHILSLTEREKFEIAQGLYEALTALAKPQADGQPFNWQSDPKTLRDLYNALKPGDWQGFDNLPAVSPPPAFTYAAKHFPGIPHPPYED